MLEKMSRYTAIWLCPLLVSTEEDPGLLRGWLHQPRRGHRAPRPGGSQLSEVGRVDRMTCQLFYVVVTSQCCLQSDVCLM